MVKKFLAGVGLLSMATFGLAAAAGAAPNPNPAAPAHTGTACTSVIANNPNAGPGSHQSPIAEVHFSDVGTAMCGV